MRYGTIIVIAITSNLEQKGIRISNNNLSDGFLPKISVIKIDKILIIPTLFFRKNQNPLPTCEKKSIFILTLTPRPLNNAQNRGSFF
jgi:hypothetical protein